MMITLYEDKARTLPLVEISEDKGGLTFRFRESLNCLYLFPEDVKLLRAMINE